MIELSHTLYQITEEFPETVPVFVSSGFEQMNDEAKRLSFGKNVNLKTALKLKSINEETFVNRLEETIKQNRSSEDLTLNGKTSGKEAEKSISLSGLLPCPVRLPLLEAFSEFQTDLKETEELDVEANLQAASMGLDWLEEQIGDAKTLDDLPDIFISAGFDMFFGESLFGKFNNETYFGDLVEKRDVNSDFSGLGLEDPKSRFSIISVVPAVFLVNTQELGEQEIPKSWADILKPEFEGKVSLPVSDFDLFNAILLNIHKLYGDDGVLKLSKSLSKPMHPAQMLKTEKAKVDRPSVTIMPYFFTKMVKPGTFMQAVWPEDGAILSPIFMLSKKEKQKQIQPLVDFFASEKTAKILSHQGLFPSLHPNIENPIPENHPFMWIGWDYIEKEDIPSLIKHCMQLFEAGEK